MSWASGQLMGAEFELDMEDLRPCGTLATRMNPYHP